jgi:hypothetical protein
MALGRFVSGLAIAAMVATTPVSAQTVAAAPQPQAEEFSDESALQGSNVVFGGVIVALIIAVLLIVAFATRKRTLRFRRPSARKTAGGGSLRHCWVKIQAGATMVAPAFSCVC